MLRPTIAIPFLAAVLLAAGCSGGGGSSQPTTTTAAAAETTSSTSTSASTTTTTIPTATTSPQRAVAAPVTWRTPCAVEQARLAKRRSRAADEHATAAERQTKAARKSAGVAARHPKIAKKFRAAARRHNDAVAMHEVAARRNGGISKVHARRAHLLNTRRACAEYRARTRPLPRMPLTGAVLGKHRTLPQRPALVVKIDNHVQARPQSGLNAADIVFEEIVEYGTRFAAVFHSKSSNPVGPIRSGRTQDIAMLGRLNRPLFAWSGGNANVTNAINASELVNVGPSVVNAYYRDGSRGVDYEHTLYSNTDALWGFAPPDWKQPGAYFRYVRPGEAFAGRPAAGVDLQLDSYSVRWAWSPERKGYIRYTSGSPHATNDGQILATNVVILETRYLPSPADARSPEAQTIGTGRAWVYSAGRVRQGTWTRPGPHSPIQLAAVDRGETVKIELTPGRTWVELAEIAVDGEPATIPVP
jgi:hypothetical protein